MKIVALDGFGGPEVLRIAEAEKPHPGAGEVLIEVAAAGVNRADLLQRQGHYPPPPGASPILGMEVSGTVAERGPGADPRWKIGDAVCALVPGGGYAEYCVASAGCCFPIPPGLAGDGISALEQAAALPEATMTVWANLFDPRRLNPGDHFLMQGGTSGVGTIAIQTALAFGAHVASTAGSDDKVRFLRQLGCEQAWNYRVEDWAAGARQWTPSGVDVILDMVGGDYFPKHVDLLAQDGRLIHIATSHGADVSLDLRKVIGKRLVITGSTLRPRSVEEKTRLRDGVEQNVWPLIGSRKVKPGKIEPIIDCVYPLAEVAEAHRRMESSQHIGKLVLRVQARSPQ